MTEQEVVAMYESGATMKQIRVASRWGFYRIRDAVTAAGVRIRLNKGNSRYSSELKSLIAADYEAGKSFSQICFERSISGAVLTSALKDNGMNARKTWSRVFTTKESIAAIRTEFDRIQSVTGLGKKFGCSRDAIIHALTFSGLSEDEILGKVRFPYRRLDGEVNYMSSDNEIAFAGLLDAFGAEWRYGVRMKVGREHFTPDFIVFSGDSPRFIVDVKGDQTAGFSTKDKGRISRVMKSSVDGLELLVVPRATQRVVVAGMVALIKGLI